ncbi:MAG: MetQ/NlpA family ABC transporter substrate-binding protein [Thermoprotei archaeon]
MKLKAIIFLFIFVTIIVSIMIVNDVLFVNRVTQINIGVLPIEDSAPIIIAQNEKLFEQEGLNVNVTLFTSARDRDIALESGKIQIAVSDPITSTIQFAQGLPIRIVSVLWGGYQNQSVFYILSPPNSTTKTLHEIRQIGISKTTIIEYVTYRLIQMSGEDPNNYEFINVPSIPIRYQLLMTGKIETVTLPDPLASLAIMKGAHVLASTKAYNKSITMSVLIANNNWLVNNREVMVKFLKAINKAIKLIISNPSKYNDLITTFIKLPEELKPYYRIGYWTELSVYPKDNFKDVLDWLLLKNYITKTVNYNDFVDTELVLNAR